MFPDALRPLDVLGKIKVTVKSDRELSSFFPFFLGFSATQSVVYESVFLCQIEPLLLSTRQVDAQDVS